MKPFSCFDMRKEHLRDYHRHTPQLIGSLESGVSITLPWTSKNLHADRSSTLFPKSLTLDNRATMTHVVGHLGPFNKYTSEAFNGPEIVQCCHQREPDTLGVCHGPTMASERG